MDAEKSVIGELLTESDLTEEDCSVAYDLLSPEMFSNALYGRFFYELKVAKQKQIKADTTYIIEKSCDDSFPQNVVEGEVLEIIKTLPVGASIKADSRIVFDNYNARKVNKFLSEIEISGNNVYEMVSKITKEFETLKSDEGNARSISEIASEKKDEYFKPKDIKPIYTGFGEWDNTLGGLESGDLIIIGARPAVGKTALGAQIASTIADDKKVTMYFNLEMSEKQVYERLLSLESGIPISRLKTAERFNTDAEQVMFNNGNARLEEKSNLIVSSGSKDISQIRREVTKYKPDIVFVDYLQLIKSAPGMSYRGNRYAEVGAISHALKAIAIDFNIPVVVLTQLNRNALETEEPSMSEIRESGDIEQDASVIILLWNLDKDDKSRKGVKFDKNRQGKLLKTELQFEGNQMRFSENFTTVSKEQEDDLPFLSD